MNNGDYIYYYYMYVVTFTPGDLDAMDRQNILLTNERTLISLISPDTILVVMNLNQFIV